MPIETIAKVDVKPHIIKWEKLTNREVYRIIGGENVASYVNKIAIFLSMDSGRGVLYIPEISLPLVSILSQQFFNDYRLVLEHLPNYKVQVVLE